MMTQSHHLETLQTALTHLDRFIRRAVQVAQGQQGSPADMLRGLVITDAEVARQIDAAPLSGLWSEQDRPPLFDPAKQPDSALAQLQTRFDLSLLDMNILLFSLAPALDRRYERLYAYLQDDVSQKYTTVLLLMTLLGDSLTGRFDVWQRLQTDQPLRKNGLIQVQADPSQPAAAFLAHQVRVAARVIGWLTGDPTPDAALLPAIETVKPVSLPLPETTPPPEAILAALPHCPIIDLRGRGTLEKTLLAQAMCDHHGIPLLIVHVPHVVDLSLSPEETWQRIQREARLTGSAILLQRAGTAAMHWQNMESLPLPVFIDSQEDSEPTVTQRSRRFLRLTLETHTQHSRQHIWQTQLTAQQLLTDSIPLETLAGKFRFTAGQIIQVIDTALDLAESRGEPTQADDFHEAARAHSTLNLGHTAKQIEPIHSWQDVVLPEDQIQQLQELRAWIEYGPVVREDWSFGDKIAPVSGVKALFAGESGTGKTLSAEVLANDLGLVLYRIDLSMVMSKYIGETEKNLRRIFEEAHASNAILFFDEADALFGKRSEVRDARDRYANVETAFLLQQFEEFDGIAILASNLRQNMDEAFTRRLDFVIDFPFPEPEYRQHIWRKHFPPDAPLHAEVDFGVLGERYELSGGNIRNAAVAAAFLAAADGRVITMTHIRGAVRREHQKMGRLLDDY